MFFYLTLLSSFWGELYAYLVDSDVLIDHLRQHKPISPFVEKVQEEGAAIRISILTRSEVYAGRSMNDPEKKKEARALLSVFDVVPLSVEMADIAGQLKRAHGINMIDALIAASALLTESTLVTRNVKHFKDIPRLEIKTP
jgi:toxin FitB